MSNQQKEYLYGAAAILTVSTILVKIIGAIFKIPLIAILPEEAYGDFNGAYNIYSFFLTISTAGLPVALSKTVSECHTLGRENQKHRVSGWHSVRSCSWGCSASSACQCSDNW